MRHLTAQQLHDYLQKTAGNPLLLDVREPWEFDTCRIEGSELIPMGQLRGELDRLDPDQEIIVICHHGIRSRAVASYLETQDFTNVVNLTGGVAAWARDVDPDMPVY